MERRMDAFDELNIEHIPGTEIMRDVGNIHFVHGPKSHEVLIPHPSEDPHDPLNWSRLWKYIAIAVQAIYCFVVVASALSMAPMFPLLGAELELSQTQLNLLTGGCVLALGYANFVIVPVSNIFGRRFASIALGVLCIGTCIWEALAKSYQSLLAARIINGFATATSESLMVQVIADIFFLHERGIWMGVYFTMYFLGLFVGPIISGNIAAAHGWRSFFWLSLGLTAFNVVTLIFLFPETKFHRRDVARTSPSDSEPNEAKASSDHNEAPPLASEISVPIGKGHPSKAQFKFISPPDPDWKSFIFRDIISPLQVFSFPIIFWAGLCVAGPANLLLLWNLTESSVLSSPPYNFSVSAVGFANFAFVVGGFVGLATAGPLSDWVAQRCTVRNNGIREAEMRLPVLLPYLVLTVVGVVIGGLAEEHLWPWPVLLCVGYGLTGVCVTSVPTIAISYAVDCYKPIAGEIMVVATVLKNTCGFAMSYWVTTLTEAQGNLTPAMVQLALTAGPIVFALPLWIWGKKVRRWSQNSNVHKFGLEY